MSDFRTFLLLVVVVVAVYRWTRRNGRVEDVTADPVREGASCPHCGKEVEPGFLECWNCGKSFHEKGEGGKRE